MSVFDTHKVKLNKDDLRELYKSKGKKMEESQIIPEKSARKEER
jgi:uncharacterized protein YneF (UPF0154 family)